MNKKQPLGEKSYKYIILQLIGSLILLLSEILCIFAFIDSLEYSFIIFIILIFILLLISIYLSIQTIIKPKYIVEYDESGIYLNYTKNKTIYILIRDIEYIEKRNTKARYHSYSFGNLIIKTKTKKYKIGVIKNLKETRDYIYSRIAYKYKY